MIYRNKTYHEGQENAPYTVEYVIDDIDQLLPICKLEAALNTTINGQEHYSKNSNIKSHHLLSWIWGHICSITKRFRRSYLHPEMLDKLLGMEDFSRKKCQYHEEDESLPFLPPCNHPFCKYLPRSSNYMERHTLALKITVAYWDETLKNTILANEQCCIWCHVCRQTFLQFFETYLLS